ncbi:uncharacterized protein DUF2589 [Nonlabens xylanidelens]|uniref:Uncharacterized protein DUF2589 n=1 Tax=Nonlabens xylanidelens TaxID=191564 RepID=A0A2S6IKQ7_9FLAO|nr:DUF2589 domain-containing protein [Nonlabens xylanidelens]PPK94817.1 uncharacterized protein DUF2589 [Nonlabens xylanidelens]PQJ17374.1 hypothetical protein BST94_09935 [Nonlabens xylanidelens]
MPNLVAELNSLDFNNYIGGPLQAAVQAQHAAAMSQVQFIQEVGFVKDDTDPTKSDLRYVDFAYKKSIPNPDYKKTLQELKDEGRVPAADTTIPSTIDVATDFLNSEIKIKVPFLTMLSIPALRIEEMTIDFNAKLTSTETSNVSSEFAASAELGINYKVVNFKASASYKRSTSRGTNVEKTYNLGVHVKVVNDELPAGLDRILTMLEDSIASVNAPA